MSNDTTAPKREATLEGSAFTGWSTSDLAGQCRMQARENLDPELTAFMFAVADRLAAHSAAPALHDDERDLTDEDRIAYWKGAYDRMAARNGELDARLAALSVSTPTGEGEAPRQTPEQVQALADAMWQLLDDMGTAGLGVCLYAKAQARIAYEPFREADHTGDDGVDWPLTDARAVVVAIDAGQDVPAAPLPPSESPGEEA